MKIRKLGKFLSLLLLLTTPLSPAFAAKKKTMPSSQVEELSPLKSLYHSLDPLSISQQLSFYELYPESKEGKLALHRAWELLSSGAVDDREIDTPIPKLELQSMVPLITRQSFDPPIKLTEEQLSLVEKIAERLHNRRLKGYAAWTREAVLDLPSEEIDLSRGLLLFQFDTDSPHTEEIRHYEALLDLMALQIRARLPQVPSDEDKIREINRFIFHEMQFRFPPHSLYANDIDLYTFLPSVIDNRQGVCLGVSILYLSLAQRLDLPLEIITPPGHIYLRYHNGTTLINIETTARGINPPSETYLGINTRKLQERTFKEVIGFAFMNQASVFWAKQEYPTVVSLYEKAILFLPEDPLLKMLLGFNYLFTGQNSKAHQMLREIRDLTFDEAVSKETMAEDYLNAKIDSNGLKAVFLSVDETRESIVAKQKELQGILKKHPHFRAGLLQLATTWLQLGRQNEAREVLQRYQKIDQTNAIIEYYLAVLSLMRYDHNLAWNYLKQAEHLTAARGHSPKVLSSLRESLRRVSPEP